MKNYQAPAPSKGCLLGGLMYLKTFIKHTFGGPGSFFVFFFALSSFSQHFFLAKTKRILCHLCSAPGGCTKFGKKQKRHSMCSVCSGCYGRVAPPILKSADSTLLLQKDLRIVAGTAWSFAELLLIDSKDSVSFWLF